MATTVQHRDRVLTEEERRVAEILTELPRLLGTFRSLSSISWGRKRRRSSFSAIPSPPRPAERPLPKVEAASPATPLSFSPSDDAGEDSKPPKISRRRDSKKKSHKELKEELGRLTAERIQLEQEYAKGKEYWNELQALNIRLNSQLKEKQSRTSYELHLDQCRSLDLVGSLTGGGSQEKHQLLPLTRSDCGREDSVSCSDEQPSSALASSGSGMALENHCFAVGIFDLNTPPKEATSLDFIPIPMQFKNTAAIAAEARRRRMEINRRKFSSALKQSRLR